jgi:Zn ribbon nucleic-acid-binding protein
VAEAPSANGQPAGDHDRPTIAERAARRDQMQAAGRDRYSALLRSLQAGRELPISRRAGRITVDWHPVLWTLLRVAVVVVIAYVGLRAGLQWWRENNVETWSGPDAGVQSGVRLADCPVVDRIRVDEFPSWVSYQGSVYRFTGLKRPYVGPQTEGYTMTPYVNGLLHLVLIENTPAGLARDTVLVWTETASAGVDYARAADCSPP